MRPTLRADIRMTRDPSDPWGFAMAWLFAIAAELDLRGERVPAELGYRAGAGGSHREADDYHAEACESAAADDLTYWAGVLHRYTVALERAGRSY